MIDRNQMLVAGFADSAAASGRDRGMPAIRAGTGLMCMIPIWLKQFRHKLSQNVVPAGHLLSQIVADPYACQGLIQLKEPH